MNPATDLLFLQCLFVYIVVLAAAAERWSQP